jgi:spore cortex biosynthesis protein YabQ
MILPVEVQLYYFLSTLIAGLGVGVMYDIYRIIRGFNSPKKFMTAISDMLFWVLVAIITFIFFLQTNKGDLGYYTFIGLSIGVLIYFKYISKALLNALRWILYYIIKIFRLILIMLIYPFRLLRYGINLLFFKTSELVVKGVKGSKKGIKKIIDKRKTKEGKKKKVKNNKSTKV